MTDKRVNLGIGGIPMPRKRTDARREWEKENIKSYTIRCNVTTNHEFAEWMEKHKPYQEYIKQLIREDMERNCLSEERNK